MPGDGGGDVGVGDREGFWLPQPATSEMARTTPVRRLRRRSRRGAGRGTGELSHAPKGGPWDSSPGGPHGEGARFDEDQERAGSGLNARRRRARERAHSRVRERPRGGANAAVGAGHARDKERTGGACPIGASGRREGGWNLGGSGPTRTLRAPSSTTRGHPVKKAIFGRVSGGHAACDRIDGNGAHLVRAHVCADAGT
jgi:hypothetical protein